MLQFSRSEEHRANRSVEIAGMAPSMESLHLSRPDTGTGQDREPETQRRGPEIELGETP